MRLSHVSVAIALVGIGGVVTQARPHDPVPSKCVPKTTMQLLNFDDFVVTSLSTPVPIPFNGFSFTPFGYHNQTPGSFNELIAPCEMCSGYSTVVSLPNALAAAVGDLIIEPYPDPDAHPDLVCTFDITSFAVTPLLPQIPPEEKPDSGAIFRMTGSDGVYKEFFTWKWWGPSRVGRGGGPGVDVPLIGKEWTDLMYLIIRSKQHANGTDSWGQFFAMDDLKIKKKCRCLG
ncbi:hypothetical protein BDZ91DRAFT_761182 [Kalaharituber pfeilii]|nr:hypothetical protein BDZ91DRAFT_761182 [Kalaharituber pfeilii]